MQGKLLWVLLALLSLSAAQSTTYNVSLCTDIEIDSFHYFVNEQEDSQDLIFKEGDSVFTYNLCQTVEVYCKYQNSVIVASMVAVNPVAETCISYTQNHITFLDGSTAGSGIKVQYLSQPTSNLSQEIVLKYSCNNDTGEYCPGVEASIMWDYFQTNIITFTIIIEIVGVILMVLGIYIYRGSIVLIGWGTVFILLTMLESLFVFHRGVPSSILQNVLILTTITSFFVGYSVGFFPKVGLFCMGMWIGLVISLTLNNVAFYYIDSNPSNLMLYIVTPILSVGFGILIQFIKKTFIIFSSSLIGSYLCLRALSWSLGAFPNEFTLSKKYHLGLEGKVPWQFYLYVVALLILTASASALQVWLFRQKMKNSNQTTGLEQHLDNMENTMKKEREQLIEIKHVFDDQPSGPRVLHKNRGRPVRKIVPEKDSPEQDYSQSAGESREHTISIERESESEGSDEEAEPEARKNLNEKLLGVRGQKR